MNYSYAEFAPVFKALGDETRLKIIDMLSCGELCACKILEEFHITQPTLSYHMKMLLESGLVKARRDGSWVHYSLCSDKIKLLTEFLSGITTSKNECICTCGKGGTKHE